MECIYRGLYPPSLSFMQRLHAMLMKSNRMAIRAEFCKNETMNPKLS